MKVFLALIKNWHYLSLGRKRRRRRAIIVGIVSRYDTVLSLGSFLPLQPARVFPLIPEVAQPWVFCTSWCITLVD